MAIFKRKKKLTEDYLKMLDCREELRKVKRKVDILKRELASLESYSDSKQMLLFCQFSQGNFKNVSVEYTLDYRKRIKELYFKIGDSFTHADVGLSNFLSIEIRYNFEDGSLQGFYIEDFIIRNPNRGYGNVLLREALFHISQLFGTTVRITGMLSPVDERDENNWKRRNYLYQKYGFRIEKSQIILDKIPLEAIQNDRKKYTNEGDFFRRQ